MIRIFRKKEAKEKLTSCPYTEPDWTPAVRSSICTGEKTVGFVNNETGKFREIELIRTQTDLDAFCVKYGVDAGTVKTIY